MAALKDVSLELARMQREMKAKEAEYFRTKAKPLIKIFDDVMGNNTEFCKKITEFNREDIRVIVNWIVKNFDTILEGAKPELEEVRVKREKRIAKRKETHRVNVQNENAWRQIQYDATLRDMNESMQVSETEEDWISNLTKYGVNVEVHDSKKRGKYYTYELMDTSKFPDGKKIPANLKSRSYKLGTRYDAEEIESYFLKKEQELQKQKAVQREVPEEKVRRQEPRTKLQEQEPVSPAPKPVHRVKQKPAQKPVARPAMPKPKVPAQTTNIVRLMGEDDIDDMTDVLWYTKVVTFRSDKIE